jgi:periplasmic protein TonB
MRSKKQRTESLDEILYAFRNKEYGAYLLRTRYHKYLIVSVISGVLIFSLAILIPYILDQVKEDPIDLTDISYVFEYVEMAPPDNNLNEIPRAYIPEGPEKKLAPVVKDTIAPIEEEKAQPETSKEETEEPSDSVTEGQAGAKNGTGTDAEGGIATVIDVFPRYPGGDDARLLFLRRNLRYPEIALKSGVQGVVVLLFIIEKDGTLTGIKVEKGIGGGCDEEAMRVVKEMPRWEPGKRHGNPVRVMMRMPIVFRLAVKS